MDSPLLNIMQKAAKKASRGLRRDFNELENLQVKTKGPANFVTASDIRTQKIIYEELKNNGVTAVKQHRVIDPGKDKIGNDIVVSGEGTGIVHMAPGCGDIDHKIGKSKDLINIAPLDEEAKFMNSFGWLNGKSATDPDTIDKIIADLKDRKFLVHVEQYPHVYPHCWRSGDELVFRLVEEWYINMDWRDKIKSVVDDINWIPS